MWMTTIAAFFCAVWLSMTAVASLALPVWGRGLMAGWLLVSSLKRPVLNLFGTGYMSPDGMPAPLYAYFLLAEGMLYMGGVLSLLWGGLLLCGAAVPPSWVLFGAVILGGVVTLRGYLPPKLRAYTVALQHLPPSAEGMRVLQLSDIHLDLLRRAGACRRLVRRVNALKPDVILITGDLEDGPLPLRREALAPLAELSAPEGVFAVTGNHEYYYDVSPYLPYYKSLGIRVLDGASATVRGVALLGVPDGRSLTRQDNGPLLEHLIRALPPQTATVLLAHKPAVAEAAAKLGVGLVLSGHTHGGQLPGVASVIARFNRGFVRGWYAPGAQTRLYVSRGCGVWCGFPFRVYGAEITLFTLSKEEA